MNNGRVELTRRQWLAGSLLALGLPARPAWALETIRQGFQTNIWGMPTYYLLKSGLLEKRGLKFEEFAVPSGNLTMQQMVARQVDLGTYAGQSFIIVRSSQALRARKTGALSWSSASTERLPSTNLFRSSGSSASTQRAVS